MYICTHVCHLWVQSTRIILWRNDGLWKWMLWRVSRHYEKSSGMSKLERSMRSVSCRYELILCFNTMPMLMIWTCCARGYISIMKAAWSATFWTIMDSEKTLEERLHGRVSVVFGCVVLLLCICCTCCIFIGVYRWYCVHVIYVVLCTSCVCSVVYRWCCVHVVYALLCTNGVVYKWCCVHLVQCTHCIYGVAYIYCCVHIVHVVLCTVFTCCVVYMWYFSMCIV